MIEIVGHRWDLQQRSVTTRYIQRQTLGQAKHEIEQTEPKERETKRNIQRAVPSMSRPGPRFSLALDLVRHQHFSLRPLTATR